MISDSYITKPKKNESSFTTYIYIHILIFCSSEIHCLTVGKGKSGSKSPKKRNSNSTHESHRQRENPHHCQDGRILLIIEETKLKRHCTTHAAIYIPSAICHTCPHLPATMTFTRVFTIDTGTDSKTPEYESSDIHAECQNRVENRQRTGKRKSC